MGFRGTPFASWTDAAKRELNAIESIVSRTHTKELATNYAWQLYHAGQRKQPLVSVALVKDARKVVRKELGI